MSKNTIKETVRELLDLAGVQINGRSPCDIRVHDMGFYARVLAGGSLALGESYMDGWWDCEALDQFFFKILGARLEKKVKDDKLFIWSLLKAKLSNPQRKSKAYEIGKRHYDIGNDLYRYMLDKRMVYSCGYWDNAETLDKAQEAKLDLICRKLGIEPGQRILDIGCGWGSLAKYMAENYKAEVIGITVSKEQVKLGRELCKELPVEIRLQDCRDIDEEFDQVVSVGMFEHVGYKNYRTFMKVASRCLKPDGRFLLHTIGSNISVSMIDPWINKYILPNSLIPSAKQIAAAAEGLFMLQDWHNCGTDYDKTLMAWHHNFTKNWDNIKSAYDERFYRMWTYYLLCCAGSFRANKNQLWQIVYTRAGSKGAYWDIM